MVSANPILKPLLHSPWKRPSFSQAYSLSRHPLSALSAQQLYTSLRTSLTGAIRSPSPRVDTSSQSGILSGTTAPHADDCITYDVSLPLELPALAKLVEGQDLEQGQTGGKNLQSRLRLSITELEVLHCFWIKRRTRQFKMVLVGSILSLMRFNTLVD